MSEYKVKVITGASTGNSAIDPESDSYELDERLIVETREGHLYIKNAQSNGVIAIYAPGEWRSAKREILQPDS